MNLFNMAKDLKGMEKMMKPALEKFMKDSGFVKKEELIKLENRIKELESDSHHSNIKNAFSKKHQYKSWNKNWNTMRLLIIFGILVFSMVFLYNQIDLVVNALNNK